jgi:hypothetical protein
MSHCVIERLALARAPYTRRMRTSVMVLSLCVSALYKALKRAVLQFEHICRLYANISRFSSYRLR